MFKSLKKHSNAILIVISFTLIFIWIYYLYFKQLNQRKDLDVYLCESGCHYLFPKELQPEKIDTRSGKPPTVILRMDIHGSSIPIYINKTSTAFNYNENLDKHENIEKLKIYKSESSDSIYKTPYLYFFDKRNLKSIVKQGSTTSVVFKKINKNIYLSYIIPKEKIKEIIKIDEEITTRINDFQRIK